jgi:hypothetical protein
MSNTIALGRRGTPSLVPVILFLLLVGLLSYWQLKSVKITTDPLVQHLTQLTGIDAPEPVFQQAIQLAAKDLADALGIDLQNYDLTLEEYEELVATAVERFGFCEQYLLYAQRRSQFSCYSCPSGARIILRFGETYKIGQTCFEQMGRYGRSLPEPNLTYREEFKGNIFEVMVAEQVKLLLFRYSLERKNIIRANQLPETELLLPPGNKILR